MVTRARREKWHWDSDDAIGVHPRVANLDLAKNLRCQAVCLFVGRETLSVGVAGNAVLIEIFDDVFELCHSVHFTSGSSPWGSSRRESSSSSCSCIAAGHLSCVRCITLQARSVRVSQTDRSQYAASWTVFGWHADCHKQGWIPECRMLGPDRPLRAILGSPASESVLHRPRGLGCFDLEVNSKLPGFLEAANKSPNPRRTRQLRYVDRLLWRRL
jgi:hypothetical protein